MEIGLDLLKAHMQADHWVVELDIDLDTLWVINMVVLMAVHVAEKLAADLAALMDTYRVGELAL